MLRRKFSFNIILIESVKHNFMGFAIWIIHFYEIYSFYGLHFSVLSFKFATRSEIWNLERNLPFSAGPASIQWQSVWTSKIILIILTILIVKIIVKIKWNKHKSWNLQKKVKQAICNFIFLLKFHIWIIISSTFFLFVVFI